MVCKNLLLFSMFALIKYISSIYIHTKSYKHEYCMTKDITESDTVHVSYIITGDNDEEKIDAKFTNPEGGIVQEITNQSGGDIKHVVTHSGIYKICFHVPKPGENFISLEFYTIMEKGHTLDMAKDGIFSNYF